jgi:hypothetical protein
MVSLGPSTVQVEDVLAPPLLQCQVVNAWIRLELEVTEVGHDDRVSEMRVRIGSKNKLSAAGWRSDRDIPRVAFDQDVLQLVSCFDTILGGAELDIVEIVSSNLRRYQPSRGQVHAHVQQGIRR